MTRTLWQTLNTPLSELLKGDEEGPPAGAAAGQAAAPDAARPPQAAEPPSGGLGGDEPKGLKALFYRKWKDPAFLKQLRTLAAHMSRDGVDLKNMGQVKEWLEKHKDAIEAGKFKDAPAAGEQSHPFVKAGADVGRNEPCPCGSGKKFKKCHGAKGS